MQFINGTDPLLSRANRQMLDKLSSNWKLTPATFAYEISRHSWIPAKHLMYISSRVAKAIARGNGRIIISAPPRHGKSQLTSIYTPAWVLENYPQYKTIITGYGADLVTGFSRQVRDLFQDEMNWGMLKTRIRDDASRVEQFLTPEGGGVFAVGLGGAITGRGANVLLIDDYIKEIKEALSPAYREYIWNWFVTTAFTRLEPGGSCIIIATRWHSDDLIGRILKELSGEGWEYIEIPAIAETDDFLGRKVGDALFPERYPLPRLAELRRTLGSTFWQALFQQKPVDQTNQLAKREWFKVVDEIPWMDLRQHGWKRIRMWDLAGTEDGGDFTVGLLMDYDMTTGAVYIENIVRDQMSPGTIEQTVRGTADADGVGVQVRIEREPGSAGKHLVHHYDINVLGRFNVLPVPATANKVARAQPFLAAAEAGKVHMLRDHWNDPFLDEICGFPTGDYDDQVDAASGAYNELTGTKMLSASWGRNMEQKTAEMAQNAPKIAPETGKLLNFKAGPRASVTFGRR